METDGYNSRRNSLGNASPSSGEKTLPRYLQPSTGSCHDFCKYGRKHEVEQKPRRPFLKWTARKPPDHESKGEFRQEGETKRILKPKHSSMHTPNTPEIIKREVYTISVDSRTPVNEVLAGRTSRTLVSKSTENRSRLSGKAGARKSILVGEKLSDSVDSHSLEGKAVARKSILVGKKFLDSVDSCSSVQSDVWEEKKKKIPSQERMKLTETKNRNVPELKPRANQKIIGQDISLSSERLMISPKQVSPRKIKEASLSRKQTSHLKCSLSSNDSRATNARRYSEVKTGQKAVPAKLIVKKAQASLRTSLSPILNVNRVSKVLISPRAAVSAKPSIGKVKALPSPRASLPLKSSLSRVASQNVKNNCGAGVSARKSWSKPERIHIDQLIFGNAGSSGAPDEIEDGHDDVQEKTLYMIEMKTENKGSDPSHNESSSAELLPPPSLSPKSSLNSESPSSLSHNGEEHYEELEYNMTNSEEDAYSEYDESDYSEEEALEGKYSGTQRVAGMTPELKDVEPVKLRFRRGKVVDIQSENNGPRRLKFRRGRILDGKNPSLNTKRSFRKRQVDGDGRDSKDGSVKVVLRHQDVQGKKDAQGLFNNVIEETASKLVETRKSKVKALVGAFETVISLQDGAPSSNAVP